MKEEIDVSVNGDGSVIASIYTVKNSTTKLSCRYAVSISGTGAIADNVLLYGDSELKVKNITHVIINEGITRVGSNLFNGDDDYLEYIYLPESLTSIGDRVMVWIHLSKSFTTTHKTCAEYVSVLLRI